MRIAFLGLGLMGAPMALNLVQAGHALSVWNRSAGKAAPLAEAGARVADTPAAAAEGAELLCLCMTDAKAVEAVAFGEGGLAGAARGLTLVDFSSVDPEKTRALAARWAEETGGEWIDAPVSGGVPAAEAGTLTIMAGGTEAGFAAARPALEAVSARATLMGPVGAGQATKLANQIIAGCTMAIVAEAVAFAEANGIDATRLAPALQGGFADSKPFQIFGPRMAARVHEPVYGTSRMMLKDLDTVREAAKSAGALLPMTSTAAELLRATGLRDGLDRDISALIEVFAGPKAG
ncbi:NAD(P)-dependent oxidoreductase [Oceanicella sp. SM1341]|uniref:NAD(P)-dependent oxidoreductase n=1 Tax=Oceanicella sp. SM1341 TaxID=1548889 RepID=UPI000E466F1C|nr:NAD(P)-dependent oxidoreductase [Oceanicella sp. SM1341]